MSLLLLMLLLRLYMLMLLLLVILLCPSARELYIIPLSATPASALLRHSVIRTYEVRPLPASLVKVKVSDHAHSISHFLLAG